MALATWWTGDNLPELAPLEGLTIATTTDTALLARLCGIPAWEAGWRIVEGNRPYIAWLNGEPAAYGWVANISGRIGELGLEFSLPHDQRYLWDFKTLPDFRGRGIYPRLLAAVLRAETPRAARLWILAAPENAASNLGIARAGFTTVGTISFTGFGGCALTPAAVGERASAAARLFGVELAGRALRPCWACETGGGCGCTASGGACECGGIAAGRRELVAA